MKNEPTPDVTKVAYNCKKATLLIEKEQGAKLTTREKYELKIHLAGCAVCRVYKKQSSLLNSMMNRIFKSKADNEVRLDEHYKQRLQKQIEAVMINVDDQA